VGGAVEHAAVEEELDRPDADPDAADAGRSAEAVLAGELEQAGDDRVARADAAGAAGDVDADGQPAVLFGGVREIGGAAVRAAVGDPREAVLVVKGEQLLDGLAPLRRRDLDTGRLLPLEGAIGVADHAGRLAGLGVLDNGAAARTGG